MNALRNATADALAVIARARIIDEAKDRSAIQRRPVKVEAECRRYRECFVYEAGELSEYRWAEKTHARGDA